MVCLTKSNCPTFQFVLACSHWIRLLVIVVSLIDIHNYFFLLCVKTNQAVQQVYVWRLCLDRLMCPLVIYIIVHFDVHYFIHTLPTILQAAAP